jgi:hypothetical protein
MQERFNQLRMADLLWDRYCKHGLRVAFMNHWGMRDDSKRALMSTALRTYLQYCKRMDIQHGVDWRQVP